MVMQKQNREDVKEKDEVGVFNDNIEAATRLPSHLQGSDKVPQNEESEPVGFVNNRGFGFRFL